MDGSQDVITVCKLKIWLDQKEFQPLSEDYSS